MSKIKEEYREYFITKKVGEYLRPKMTTGATSDIDWLTKMQVKFLRDFGFDVVEIGNDSYGEMQYKITWEKLLHLNKIIN